MRSFPSCYSGRTLNKQGSVALATACERALFASARGAATRQQVRAAARCFVRRHRRDSGYLVWVLRSVGASSLLAVALLGLGAAPVRAELVPFRVLTGAANPFEGLSAGLSQTSLALGDLDRDGDLDGIAGEQNGEFRYFRNNGSALGGSFTLLAGSGLDGEDVGDTSRPALGDLDGDGDLDLVAGALNGAFFTYRNTGDAANPAFIPLTGSSNPLDSQSAGSASAPALGDLDGDGDLDLVAGEQGGALLYFRNTGSAVSPAFAAATGASNPLPGQDLGSNSNPALGDLDGDGDLDLVVGELAGSFLVFENTGSATSPKFIQRTGAANPLAGAGLPGDSAPSFGDYDGDGDVDLAAGQSNGVFAAFEHLGGKLVPRTGTANPLAGATLAGDSAASFGDLDGDGDRDLVAGQFDGTFRFFRNTGSAASPAFAEQTGAANPLDGRDVGDSAIPALADLDADGRIDLVAGASDGTFRYFRNTGGLATPAFTELTGASNPLNTQDVGGRAAPSLADLDADGDLDLFAGVDDGTLRYYRNTGSAAAPAFAEQIGAGNPLDGVDIGSQSVPALGDVDGDGDRDLFIGELFSAFHFFENTGSAASPAFIERSGPENPLDGETAGGFAATPAFVDLDRDRDLDLVSGNSNGTFTAFANFIPQVVPAFELTGSADPLVGLTAGTLSAPALGDLDGDGDPDLVSGNRDGQFRYFRNTGSATRPAFAAITGAANPFDGVDVGDYSSPAFGDLDGDGDLDFVAGEFAGEFFYFENGGGPLSPVFTEQTGSGNPFDALLVPAGWSTPALGDLDGDGDLDLVTGEALGGFHYYENVLDAVSPVFSEQTGPANPFYGYGAGSFSTAALGDFDGDGDLDLVSGEVAGGFAYFNNTGSATGAAFAALTGAASPLAGADVGSGSAPTTGDLDGDADPDLVTGKLSGAFSVHYFPEPARGLLFASGAALISLLDRARRRSPR